MHRPSVSSASAAVSIRWLPLALAFLCLAAAPAQAQEPQKIEAFVYTGYISDGCSYSNTFYPPAVDTIYLLANRQNILSPRRTLLTYWPLTDTYEADWTAMDQTVSGDMDILAGNAVVARIPQESHGLRELMDQGSVVNLPAGRYAIRLRTDEGSIFPGSQKRLVVFAPRRQGLGYQIVPQEEWIRPARTDVPADVIYAQEGSVLYLQPYVEEEYNDLYYARLEDPQSRSGRRDSWRWVHVRPFERAGNLILDFDGQTDVALARPYLVEQLPGSRLRYKVVDYDADAEKRPPDFVAYQLFVDAHHARYSLRLQDADGRPVFGSQRQVRRVPEVNSWALTVMAGLPMTVGVYLLVSRHERLAASRKALPPETSGQEPLQ